MIHPSAKLTLFGLRMQALHGDAPAQSDGKKTGNLASFRGLNGSALSLQRLKIEAWRAAKSKAREEAMDEYVELLTSIAPQWSIANMLGAHDSMKDDKPRQMVWVLEVEFQRKSDQEVEKVCVLRETRSGACEKKS